MPKWIFDNINSKVFPNNMNELHFNLKQWIITSVFNASFNLIQSKTDMSDDAFDMLKSQMSSGMSGPQLELYWDWYFTSFFFGTKFFPMKPVFGQMFPMYLSEVWPIGMFSSLITTVIDDQSQLDLRNRYMTWIISQKSIEQWSIISPIGVLIPGPILNLPLVVIPEKEENNERSISGS